MQETSYTLDRHDIITSVSEEWDSFAVANEGRRAKVRHVIGRSLWGFIGSPGVRIYTNAVFFAARHWNITITVPMRCDAPQVRREYQMIVEPMPDKGLRIRQRPVSEELAKPRQETDATYCAICCEEIEETGEDVCKECRTFASGLIARLGRDYGAEGRVVTSMVKDQSQPPPLARRRDFDTG